MRERLGLGAIIVAALALRLAVIDLVPLFHAPDEASHVRFVRYLVKEHALPVQPPFVFEEATKEWHEYHQPPLAYLLFAATEAALERAGVAPPARVRALRLHNALHGALLVAVGHAVAGLLGAGAPLRLGVALLLAFLPGMVSITSAVNNDALAILLVSGLWIPLLRGSAGPWPAVAGAVFGLACLAKLTVAPLAPLLLVVPWVVHRTGPKAALGAAAIASLTALVLLSPWMVRNTVLYGNPLAMGIGSMTLEWFRTVMPQFAVDRVARPGLLRDAFLQFWGVFGIQNQLLWRVLPGVLTPLFGVALLGWLRLGRRREPAALVAAAPALALSAVLSAAWLVYVTRTYVGGGQGRYLYPSMLPVCLLFAGGIRGFTGPDTRRAVAAFAALAALLVGLDVAILFKLRSYYHGGPPIPW